MHLSISIAVHNLLWKKCCLFALFLHFTFIKIELVVWNDKKSNCTKPFIFGVRFVWEIWTNVSITCSRALWQPSGLRKNRVCCKIHPTCEANDDSYTTKNRLMLRRAAAAYCPHLSLVAKRHIDYQIRYRPYDYGTGNSSQKIKYFTWYLYFQTFSCFSLLLFSSFCND